LILSYMQTIKQLIDNLFVYVLYQLSINLSVR
jgi:hypothetical protein